MQFVMRQRHAVLGPGTGQPDDVSVSYTHLDVYKRQIPDGGAGINPGCNSGNPGSGGGGTQTSGGSGGSKKNGGSLGKGGSGMGSCVRDQSGYVRHWSAGGGGGYYGGGGGANGGDGGGGSGYAEPSATNVSSQSGVNSDSGCLLYTSRCV